MWAECSERTAARWWRCNTRRAGSSAVTASRSSVRPAAASRRCFHLLAALDEPTSGTVTWPALGERDTLRPSKISFVFQTESLLAPLTVLENIEVPRLLAGSNADQARNDASEILGALDLGAARRQAARGDLRRPGAARRRRAQSHHAAGADSRRRADRAARSSHRRAPARSPASPPRGQRHRARHRHARPFRRRRE